MKPEPHAVRQRMDHFKDVLRRSGIKLTHQRLVIFQEVAKSGDHPDAETIFKGVRHGVPTMSLDTVYRSLWLMVDLGIVATLGPPRERVRFDANTKSHHHFVCVDCGMTRDFYCEEFDRLKIPNTVKTLGSVEVAQVEIRGRCLQCSKSNRPQQRASRKRKSQ
jgi:Fur family transcriptional regulator, peroxide stress response regulator